MRIVSFYLNESSIVAVSVLIRYFSKYELLRMYYVIKNGVVVGKIK